jgi:hypothetical protein
MADFAEAITDERVGRRLARAIQGKGAFRRSTNSMRSIRTCCPPGTAFAMPAPRAAGVEWLADNSLIDDKAASHFLASDKDPDLP